MYILMRAGTFSGVYPLESVIPSCRFLHEWGERQGVEMP